MKTSVHFLSLAVLVLSIFVGSFNLTTGTAQAAGPCGAGYNLVDHYPVGSLGAVAGYGSAGTPVTYIDLYWSATAHRNCAIANAAGPTYGKNLLRTITIGGDQDFYPCGTGFCGGSTDQGYYSYYAGPVYTKVQSGRYCISLLATVRANYSSPYIGERYIHGVHC